MTSNFSRMPSVTISRSKFKRKSQHKTSLKLGELTPIYLDEVLPGDTRSIDIGSLIRMSNPIAPVMDNVYLDIYAFFVPNRLVWTHWKEFMGENNSSAGIYSGTEYTIPSINLYGLSAGIRPGSVGDHFGLPCLSQDATKSLSVSTLPVRGYRRIYNRFFRDQNLIAPITVNMADSGNPAYDEYNVYPLKVAKVSDYFTRSLPYAQKGAPVTIPLGTNAPVFAGGSEHALTTSTYLKFRDINGSALPNEHRQAYFNGEGLAMSSDTFTGGHEAMVQPSNLYADLSQATSATINTLRFAFQYQKLLEKDAVYGTRLNTR